jgi:DNA-binding CsgD family transcriptional regulator
VGTVVPLSPSVELPSSTQPIRGRFALSGLPGDPRDVASVSVERPGPGPGAPGRWRVLLQDRSGAALGTLELWPDAGPADAAQPRPSLEALTPRQREILRLVAEGCAVKQIGDRLGISIKTVEFHKTRLMRRLKLHGTAELTRFAVATGLIEL